MPPLGAAAAVLTSLRKGLLSDASTSQAMSVPLLMEVLAVAVAAHVPQAQGYQ
jgi:hypothetical protein